MRKDLCRRLGQLERALAPAVCVAYVYIAEPLPPERKAQLVPGERIVLDHFRQRGALVEASQRIATNPRDQGRRCEPEGYLPDIIERIHKDCYWRERPGNCNNCLGTPFANT